MTRRLYYTDAYLTTFPAEVVGRAEDGALLVRERKTATQFFLFTPSYGYTDSAWVRFGIVPAATAELAATEATP